MDEDILTRISREFTGAGLAAGATLHALRAGTAGSTARVESAGRRFFLRRRSREHGTIDSIRYEHDLMLRLSDAGLPVQSPIPADTGERFLEGERGIYELYPWVDGALFEDGNLDQIRVLGTVLARFHEVGRELCEGKVDQGREDDPKRLRRDLREYLPREESGSLAPLFNQVDTELEQLESLLTTTVYGVLPETIIHGDLHPGNLLFADGRVTGIFDFDWANRRERIRDICDGLLFFAGIRASPLCPEDIWSLTEGVEISSEPARQLVEAYESRSPLSPEERLALPLVMATRWLQIRIRGMRKVQPNERVRFLERGDLMEIYDGLRAFDCPN